jgi:hypothetical protein
VEHLDQRNHPERNGDDPYEFTDIGIRIEFINGVDQIEEEALVSLIVWNATEPALQERETAFVRQGIPMDP